MTRVAALKVRYLALSNSTKKMRRKKEKKRKKKMPLTTTAQLHADHEVRID